MNLANLITVLRLLAVPLIVWLILTGQWLGAFVLFVAAGASDALDGWLARHHDMRTELGAVLDPLADKVLMVSIFVTLSARGELPLWIVILAVSRDVLIVGGVLVGWAMDMDLKIAPLAVGKLNTVAQIALAALTLGHLAALPVPELLADLMVYVVAATTVVSGGSYIVNWLRATEDRT